MSELDYSTFSPVDHNCLDLAETVSSETKCFHSVSWAFWLITKIFLYNFDPLKPHFYTVKLGFTGYTLFFLFLLKNIDCRASTHNLCFEQKYEKYQIFFIWKFSGFFFVVKFSVYLNRRVFVMWPPYLPKWTRLNWKEEETTSETQDNLDLIEFEIYGPFSTNKLIPSRSVYLTTHSWAGVVL